MEKFVIILTILAFASSELFSVDKWKDIRPLITGGSPAIDGQIPYQVAIATVNNGNISLCGGTLIKHKWVLTGASCLQTKFQYYLVVFGSLRLIEDEPAYLFNSSSSSNFIIHPNYNSLTNANNIALLKIDEMPKTITNHKNIEYIGLPTEEEAKTNLTGRDITISGYGFKDDGFTTFNMHYTTVKLAPIDVCKNFVYYDIKFNVTESTLCIDTVGGKSPCADGGGPMTIEIGSKKVLVGIMCPSSRTVT
ncbi:brachyurin-like [Chironomus tepperi]|uniref:brachyurin-like n=1 Tax=Chironomus tepperi TaxID=113505 RepID=UPI00391F32EF